MESIAGLIVAIVFLLIALKVASDILKKTPGVGPLLGLAGKAGDACWWTIRFVALLLKQVCAGAIFLLARFAPPNHGWRLACNQVGRQVRGNGRLLPR